MKHFNLVFLHKKTCVRLLVILLELSITRTLRLAAAKEILTKESNVVSVRAPITIVRPPSNSEVITIAGAMSAINTSPLYSRTRSSVKEHYSGKNRSKPANAALRRTGSELMQKACNHACTYHCSRARLA